MNTHYTDERNAQILIYLLKAHGIKKIIASPGTTNIFLVASLQQDKYFELYSAPDERSAAYMACGMSAESGEAVVITCTGATASRNYLPGLTEAFYRKLPILAITATQHIGRVGRNTAQVIDRSTIPNDIAKKSVNIPTIYSKEDEYFANLMMNEAILDLFRNGGGPVHINITTQYSTNFDVIELPVANVIRRYTAYDILPEIRANKVAIFVGAHKRWSDKLTSCVELFCEKYNAVVFCDHTSNYFGKYRCHYNIVSDQMVSVSANREPDILIYLGDISGAYMKLFPKCVWRVNPDGDLKDPFEKIENVFQMEEEAFFETYNEYANSLQETSYYRECQNEVTNYRKIIPELPFSNPWIAQQTSVRIPNNSVLHFGILNSLRSWNLFEIPNGIEGYANTGGFGIDGSLSTVVGASLCNKDRIYYCFLGDLAFFYDINALGNRHIGKNLRILLVNNGRGTEFTNSIHRAAKFGEDANDYIAAAGHYGYQSSELVKNYAENLGFRYLSARNKKEYLDNIEEFLCSGTLQKSIVLEVFTDSKDESEALELVYNLNKTAKSEAKKIIKNVLGENTVNNIKKILKNG